MRTYTISFALLAALVATPAAAQNAVTDWSLTAQNVITAGRSPGSSEYLLALVHAAMYDAVVAVEGRYTPFRVQVQVTAPASPAAAAAAAAYHVLHHRVPSAEPGLTAAFTAYVASLPSGAATQNGLTAGAGVAAQWIALRSDDRFDVSVPYQQPPAGPGVWEPTAPAPPVDVKLAQVRPYVMATPDRFRPGGPRRLSSRAYARAFEEVFELGRVDGAQRTSEQLAVARFWAEHTAVQWSRNLRRLAMESQLDVVQAGRLLAMAHVASADAVVGCFDAKYAFLSWRPVHAIQRADTDDNPWTTADSTWSALLNVNHPEYPSAHACWTAAVTDTLAFFFRTDKADVALDSAVTGTTRSYSRFSEVSEEVADARIWAGLHFRFSTDDGASLGRQVARLVTRHFFRPVKRHP